MEPQPGIPGDLFPYVDAVPGLVEILDDDPTIDDFIGKIVDAAAEGLLSAVVVDHVVAWNELKRDSPTHRADYRAFADANRHRWAEEGLSDPAVPASLPDPGPTPSGLGVDNRKVGRNAPCPCGTGRKFKHCCGG